MTALIALRHILRVMFDRQYNLLHINPGAAGRQGFHKVSTLVRFVIDGDTPFDEFLSAINVISSISKDILLIIQPVTPVKSVRAVPSTDLLNFQASALKYLSDVLIIPQTHRIINVL